MSPLKIIVFISVIAVITMSAVFLPNMASSENETDKEQTTAQVKLAAEQQEKLEVFYNEVEQAQLANFYKGIEQHNLDKFYAKAAADEAERIEAEQEAARQAELARQEELRRQQTTTTTQAVTSQSSYGSGRCGGDLPPCCVMERESGGDPTAQNPNSSASGKWQFINSTWNNYGGYPNAASAPESVQDAFARQLYANGAGASHWAGPGC